MRFQRLRLILPWYELFLKVHGFRLVTISLPPSICEAEKTDVWSLVLGQTYYSMSSVCSERVMGSFVPSRRRAFGRDISSVTEGARNTQGVVGMKAVVPTKR